MFALQPEGLLRAAPPCAVVMLMWNVSVLRVKQRTAPAALAGEGNEAARPSALAAIRYRARKQRGRAAQ
jgi:hypothetical protein